MLRLARRYSSRNANEWKPLFYRILENGIRDWHRRRSTRRRWLGWLVASPDQEDEWDDPIANAPDLTQPDPAVQTERSESMVHVERALHTLPLRQQQAFLLRAWEGMSTAETATAMGCSTGSVKTHYSRALQALRHQLEETKP